MKALKQLEKDIEKSILEYLEYLPNCYAWKNPTTGYFDPKRKTFVKQRSKYAINGVSDILGIFNGRMICIEVKTPENKTRTEDQNLFINTINKLGGVAFYATSIDDVKKGLGL